VPVTTLHTYKNRVQASHEIVRFQNVDRSRFQLFAYPEITNFYYCPSILGDGGPTKLAADDLLGIANAKLGSKKQVRIWILVFKDQPPETGEAQYHYWKGGNKNEFILCIGVDKHYMIQWCKAISWTTVADLKEDAQNFVLQAESHQLDLVAIVTWVIQNVEDRFVRKEFSDFSRISVDPPLWAVLLTFLLTAIVNVALSAWIIHNDHLPQSSPGRSQY